MIPQSQRSIRLSLLLPLTFFLGCTNAPEGLRVGATRHQQAVARTIAAEPILLQNSKYALIPVWSFIPTDGNKIVGDFSGGFSSGNAFYEGVGTSNPDLNVFPGYKIFENLHWNNLIFYDKKTGQSHLLLDHRAVICRAYLRDRLDPNGDDSRFFFAIADADTNGDGFINDQDAVGPFATDEDGAHPVRITPAGTRLTAVIHDPGSASDDGSYFYARVLRDRGDHRFAEGESESLLIRVQWEDPSQHVPVTDDEAVQRARAIATGEAKKP